MTTLYNLTALNVADNFDVTKQIARIFKLYLLDGKLSSVLDESECTGRVTSRLASKLSLSQVVTSTLLSRHFEDGPKSLSMKPREYEALENTALTLPSSEYQQPFPVVCFPIPEGYGRDRYIKITRENFPKYCLLGNWSDMVLVTIVYARDFAWSSYIPKLDTDLEAGLADPMQGYKIEASVDDLDTIRRICRACLNGCLVFDQVKTSGFTIRSGKKPVKTDEVIYSFDQSVRLYSREGGERDSEGDGSAVRPHWRRGHWRMQAHGVGLGLRKRIRIAPVLVRRDRFAGDLVDAKSNYS